MFERNETSELIEYVPGMSQVHTSMYLIRQNHSADTMFLLLTMGKYTVCTGQVRGGV